jgi:hypothetical protein
MPHYVGLRVDPNHHHLAAKPGLVPAKLLKFGPLLQILCGKVPLDLLI